MKLSTKLYDHFTVANNIEKLTEPIFVRDSDYDRYMYEKLLINHNPSPKPPNNFKHSCGQALTVLKFIKQETEISSVNLGNAAAQLQEDIAIFRVHRDMNWLSYCHISFPAGWRPEEAIGKSFQEIHKDVPGFVYNPKIMQALLYGRYQRFLWGTIYENKLNNYPGEIRPFTLDKPQFWLKIEKQITVGFPDEGCFLFVMREYIYDVSEIDLNILANTINNMTDVHKAYKGITPEFERYLQSKI